MTLTEVLTFLEKHNGAVTAIATVLIAAFTVVLALVTIRQARLTKVVAEAAKRSAEAAIGVELPRVFISSIELQVLGAGNFAAQIQYPRALVAVKNYGRTPAFILQQATEITVGLPQRREYPNAHDLDSGSVIEGGARYELPLASGPFLDLNEIQEVMASKREIWVYGYISYKDFLGDHHCNRFCASLYIPDSVASSRGISAKFIQGGAPPGYEEIY